jgi:hyaluronan synthase
MFMRQQMRWKRSWIRECFRASSFMWRKPPLMALSFYLGLILPILGPAIVFRAIIYVPLFHLGSPLMYLFGILLMSMMMSLTYLYVKRSKLWIYGILFCFLYMFVVIWQLPWAMVTYMTSSWSTRSG